jgi:lipopolysaccharide transport system permease protein
MPDSVTQLASERPVLVIRRARNPVLRALRELWDYRELGLFLVWRDVKVRYKQTALGAAWAILQPLLLMVVFTVFLGNLASVPSNGVPYPIFSFSALVPWTLFASALAAAATSLVQNSSLVSKVYFSRLSLPLAAALACIVDFLFALVVLVGMLVVYGYSPGVRILWLPVLVLLALLTAVAVGTWLAALNVRYRDFRYVVPFLVQLWLFATPVAYGSSLVPEKWRLVLALNPMAGVVEGFRWALVGAEQQPSAMIAVSAGVTLLVLVSGLIYFQRVERTFADVI